MCGFAGFLGGTSFDGVEGAQQLLQKMSNAVRHRGPDDDGLWLDARRRIGLGHRRLSIIDLSSAGHQPMVSASGRYVIVLNGEIYNHLLLREVLGIEGRPLGWRGHSDTETLLAGFDAWGIQDTIRRAIGMFAFAVWDQQSEVLTLGRDRIGEKPLYYGWQGDTFLFGSELKALRVHPAFQGKIDRGALSLFLRHNCIPAPYSIYEGIAKLRPGCLLAVSLYQRAVNVTAYWSGVQAIEAGVVHPFADGCGQAVDELEALLKDAVHKQMMSDVPLGAFLSGGVDSSTVVALMQMQSRRPVKTFTIGFHETGYNEAGHAKAVARHLGTEHTELYVTPQEVRAVIPRVPEIYDEPFSDSSQIPTFLVAQLARQHVAVALSGDAGDELFGGYNRYQFTAGLWRQLKGIPLPLRQLAAKGAGSFSPKVCNRLAGVLEPFLPRAARQVNMGEKFYKMARVLASRSSEDLYLGLVSHGHDPASVVIGGHEPATLLTGDAPAFKGLDEVERMMALDLLTYLPDDILVKVDRAAMAVSLETRVPFLDHRVVEFAWRLPRAMKLRDGQTKWVLRQVLYRHVPRELIERPKAGFGMPIDSWLRGPLKSWADDLLSGDQLKRQGFFDHKTVESRWQEHKKGTRNWQFELWDILMFNSWLQHHSNTP